MENRKLKVILEKFRTGFSHRHFRLPVILENSGKISDVLSGEMDALSASHITAFLKLLSKGQYIQDFFEIPAWEGKKAFPVKTGDAPFPLKPQYLNLFTDYHQYSIIPSHFCHVLPFEKGRLAGLIYSVDAFPETDYFENIGFYYNEKQELVAFNFPFFSLVSDYYRDPQALLGKPLRDIFVETPEDLAGRGLKTMDTGPVDAKHAGPLSLNPAVGDIVLSHPALSAVQNGTALRISNTGDDYTLMTCGREIDYLKEKHTFRITYESRSGHPPVIMIGYRGFSDKNFLTPDQAGYALSPATLGGRLLFKKLGYLVASAPFQTPAPGLPHSLEFTMGRRHLTCALDGRAVFTFNNIIPFHGYQTYLNLGIRPGHEFLFSEMSLARAGLPEPDAAGFPDLALQLKYFPGRYFAFTRMANPIIKASTLDVRGLMMHEVTGLRKKVDYERERGKKLMERLRLQEQGASSFIGSSLPVQRLLEHARTIAATNYTVLIQGATGTGKEVLARHIHDKGAVARGPFVKIDCSTIPQTLFESNVFGHVKGAFTGAHADMEGLLEKASGGTAFIDEIQNLALEAQAKMLQVMQDATITRVGGNAPIRLSVRFIVASNQNLEEWVRQGRFREDLFFRVNVVMLNVPPLSGHRDDIPELCEHFIRQYNLESGKNIETIDPKCYPLLFGYEWPGNIRELKNVITHACIFSSGSVVSEEIIRQSIDRRREARPAAPALPQGGEGHLGRITQSQLVQLLEKHRGGAGRVAKEMGVSRNTVYYNLRRFNLKLQDYRQG